MEPERGLLLFQAPNRDGTALRVDFTYDFLHTNGSLPTISSGDVASIKVCKYIIVILLE